MSLQEGSFGVTGTYSCDVDEGDSRGNFDFILVTLIYVLVVLNHCSEDCAVQWQ